MGFISQKAFLSDSTLKATILARVQAQATANTAKVATIGEDARGSSIWWTSQGADPGAYEGVLGIPLKLALVKEHIFKDPRLPIATALAFPAAFVSAIPVGADLNPVYPLFATWLLNDATDGMLQFANAATATVITSLVALYAVPTPPGDPAWIGPGRQAHTAWLAAEGTGSAPIVRQVAQHCIQAANGGVSWGVAGPVARRAKLLALLAAAV